MSQTLNRRPSSASRVAAIVLAAGQSRRLGKPKQLIEIEGQPLVRRTVQTVVNSFVEHTFVVLGHEEAEIASQLEDLEVTRIVAPQYASGLSYSVRHGLHQIQTDIRKFQAVLFAPCDLPMLTTEHLNRLVERYHDTHAPIVCSEFEGALGIPALFAAATWADFEMLTGDQGARPLIQACSHREAVAFAGGAFDIDTPDDLKRWRDL